ncbi:MAG: glycosyltransferase family 2 protein [Candidatus Pacearchaeota archaeon]
MKLSIIIPAHNEEKRISRTLEDYGKFFSKRYKKDFEIIVILNGCTDNTYNIVKKFKKKYSQIKYLDFKQAGKGFAIIEGFKIAKGNLIGFTDADDSTNAEEFEKLISNIKDYDGIIASRYLKESEVFPKQSFKRIVVSRIFNFLVRILFRLPYKDTQLGAKIFKRRAIKEVLLKLGLTEWAFDVDLLYNLKIKNFKIKEIPIKWKELGGSKLDIEKISIQMLLSIIQLRIIHSPFKKILKQIPLIKFLYTITK